jgi:uncharacterized metal-binding protein YceD (DUF177 family)
VNTSKPEFSRPIEVNRIPPAGSAESIVAEPTECEAVARRLGLPAIAAIEAELVLSRWRGAGIKVTGRFAAEVEQVCVVTLDPFRARVSEAIERYFLPSAGGPDLEADIDPLENGLIDLGELVVESLSLALDPYPRKPGVQFGDSEWEPQSEELSDSPFAALARRKGQDA